MNKSVVGLIIVVVFVLMGTLVYFYVQSEQEKAEELVSEMNLEEEVQTEAMESDALEATVDTSLEAGMEAVVPPPPAMAMPTME